MKLYRIVLIAFVVVAGFSSLFAQIPSYPNKSDKQGRRQGSWVIYFNKNWEPTRIKDSITFYRVLNYKNDLPQGFTRDYFRSGQKQWEARLVADRPTEIVEGKATWYHDNGAISSEVSFINGLKEGPEIAYYPSQKKYSETFFKSGLVQNKINYYDESGPLINVEFYENGEKQSLQTIWDKAFAFYENGNYKETEPLVKDLYIAIKNIAGADDGNCAYILNLLWTSQINLNQPDEAIKTTTELCRVRELQNIPSDSTYRDWLYEMVKEFKNAERIDDMETPLMKLLKMEKEISGDNSDHYSIHRRTLGDYYRLQKRFDESEKVILENIARIKKKYPNQPDRYSYELTSLGYLYETQKEYNKAEKLYTEAIEHYREQKDTTSTFATALTKLVDLYEAQGKALESIPYASELVTLERSRHGKFSSAYSDALLALNKAYRETGQFEKTEHVIKEQDEIITKLYGQESEEYSSVQFTYALLYSKQKRYEAAEPHYVKALEILKRINANGSDQSLLRKQVEIQAYLGEMYVDQKNTIKAEIALSEAAETMDKLEDKNRFVIAQVLEKLGTAQLKIQNYHDAEEFYKEAAVIAENVFGINHRNYFMAISNLCVVYMYTNKSEQAINRLDDLLQKMEASGEKDSGGYIAILESKVLAHQRLKQDSISISLHKEIANYYLTTYGDTYPSYFDRLTRLTLNQINAQLFTEAEDNIKRLEAIAIKRNIKKTDPPYYDNILLLKMTLANMKKDYQLAIELSKEQVEIGRALGQPKVGLVGLAMNEFFNDNNKQAVDAYQRYINLVIDDVTKTFPYLSENQKVSFYTSEVEYHLDLYYYIALAEPLGLKMNRDSAELKAFKENFKKPNYIRHPNNESIFNYQLITKGILFEANQKMKDGILKSKDDALINLFKQWQAKKDQMNKAFLEPDSKQKEEKKNQINADIKSIEKQLTLKSSYFTQTNDKRYTWSDVQKKLKKGEAMVEIVAVSAGLKLNPTTTKYSDMYLAFVITPDTKDYPLCVRINVGDSLEGRYAKNYQNSIKLRQADNFSYNKFWKVLADTLKSVRKIYFAPDGIYHKVNINTLRNPATGKYVLEEKDVQFISQSRDLIVHTNLKNNVPNRITLFGAPNYNSLPSKTDKTASDQKNKQGNRNVSIVKQDTTQRFLQGDNIAELPGTEVEVNNVAAMAQLNQLNVQKFLGDDATEVNLKMAQNPSILHIATHGFFMSEVSAPSGDNERARAGFANFTYEDLKNPLRRSGLLFSYCKHAFGNDQLNLPEDGILTSEEAQNLHLDKTEMVVLSACETGLGEVKNGEGVYGLQRAFQTAGAQSVLMSLWTVSDQATQELMTAFYSEWFKLKDKRQAFRQAQLNVMKKYADPFYWGAFVMVGD